MNKFYQQYNNQSLKRQSQPNNIGDLYKQFQKSTNKNGFILNLMQQNPKFKEVIDLVQQNGGDAKQVFYQLAQANNVDPDSILNPLK